MSTLIFQLDALTGLLALSPSLKILKLNLVFDEQPVPDLVLDRTEAPKPFDVLSQQLRDFSVSWAHVTPPPQIFISNIAVSYDVVAGGNGGQELRFRTGRVFLEQLAGRMASS